MVYSTSLGHSRLFKAGVMMRLLPGRLALLRLAGWLEISREIRNSRAVVLKLEWNAPFYHIRNLA